MTVMPLKKIKSKQETFIYLSDPEGFKTFYLALRKYLKSTQHLCVRERHESDHQPCIHSGYHESETFPFRRFIRFCYERGVDWKMTRDMMELTLRTYYYCDCQMWRGYTDEQVEAILSGRRK